MQTESLHLCPIIKIVNNSTNQWQRETINSAQRAPKAGTLVTCAKGGKHGSRAKRGKLYVAFPKRGKMCGFICVFSSPESPSVLPLVNERLANF